MPIIGVINPDHHLIPPIPKRRNLCGSERKMQEVQRAGFSGSSDE
jgi:hypothetical protein